jgi:mutator protein MutT
VYGGYWEFPGGKCADGESPEACVVRELAEEVGVAAEVFGLLSGVIHTYPHGTVRLHPRLCRLTAGSGPPRNLQVAEHRWVSIEGLGAFRFPEANEAILRELRAWVGGRSGA